MKKMILCAICAICGFATANAQKFGHVNSQEVIQAMPEFAKARADIETLTKQYEADLKSMQEELQKMSTSWIWQVASPTLAPHFLPTLPHR
jgi:outer membrane protein